VDRSAGFAQIALPDGSTAWVAEADLLPIDFRPSPDEDGIRAVIDLFRRFVGVPYQWGGRTPFGFDCSGLAGTFWEFLGVRLKRDADQQFAQGTPVAAGDYLPGDLLFFGEPRDVDDPGRAITHVAISLGGDDILHANGTTWSTAYNSLKEGHPLYRPWLRDNLVGVRRYH
jgi:cell wall-associated NlpC family hydrolase